MRPNVNFDKSNFIDAIVVLCVLVLVSAPVAMVIANTVHGRALSALRSKCVYGDIDACMKCAASNDETCARLLSTQRGDKID